MVRRGWDSGLDFEEAYRRILDHMLSSRSPYDVVLLIQLRNGSRVGEAVEAVRQFCASGQDLVLVRIEKHKDGDLRLMVLPEELRSGEGRQLLSEACAKLPAIREPVEVLALSNVIRISLAGLTRTLARELGKYGIRVNMVLPGNIETDRSRQVIESRARAKGISYEEELKAEMADVPLGRIGKPEEVGEVVEFLLSERASYVSGAAIPVDGGLLHGVF